MRRILTILILSVCCSALADSVKALLSAKLLNVELNENGIVPVEYIETQERDKTKYLIHTGVVPSIATRIELAIEPNISFSGWQLNGVGNTDSTRFAVRTSGTAVWGLIADQFLWTTCSGRFSVVLDAEKSEISVGEDIKRISLEKFNPSAKDFTLFAVQNPNGYIDYPCAQKLFFFRCWENNELIRDLIPVRFFNGESWEGALYDYVSDSVFLNQGTGDFLLGPDL